MASIAQKNSEVNFPAVDYLEKRFLFIKDEILRENVAIAFQYIIFLIGLSSYHGVRGPVEYSRNKDVVLYAGAIIESCMHYVISEYLSHGLTSNNKIMPSEWKLEKCIQLYKIDESTKEVCGVIRHKVHEKFSDSVQFKQLNKIALDLEILNKSLYLDAEYIRERRNKVHLVGLKNDGDLFDKYDVEKVFTKAGLIISRIEDKLKDIN